MRLPYVACKINYYLENLIAPGIAISFLARRWQAGRKRDHKHQLRMALKARSDRRGILRVYSISTSYQADVVDAYLVNTRPAYVSVEYTYFPGVRLYNEYQRI